MKIAEKTGVFNVLSDMYFDAHQKMHWLEKKRIENKTVNIDDEEPMFPGYEERYKEVQDELRDAARKQIEYEAAHSIEVLGAERSGFHLGQDSKVDLLQIYKKFTREGLRNFTREEFADLMQKGEVIAFMTQLKANKRKHDDGGVPEHEEDLVEYVKYLVGEQKNVFFKFNRNDFSQKHELNKQSLK